MGPYSNSKDEDKPYNHRNKDIGNLKIGRWKLPFFMTFDLKFLKIVT